MAWIEGTFDGDVDALLNTLINFLTNDPTLVADGDNWEVIAEITPDLPHPTDSNYTVLNGYYLRGPAISDGTLRPHMLVYSAKGAINQALCFTGTLNYDAQVKDMWWAQPGGSYHYAPVTIPMTANSHFEFMANGRRVYGYIKDENLRHFPFYAGWLIPYTDFQDKNYNQPLCFLGSDRYLAFSNPGNTDTTYAAGLGMIGTADSNTPPSADRANHGCFLYLPSGAIVRIQAQSASSTSARTSFSRGQGDYSIKFRSPISAIDRSILYPESYRIDASDNVLLGELDGIAAIGIVGATSGSIISQDDTQWLVLFGRNTPNHGVDGFALRRA